MLTPGAGLLFAAEMLVIIVCKGGFPSSENLTA